MGQLENWKMTPLDALLSSNQLQILKTMVFFFPPARQRQMILLIKFMELRQCLSLPLSVLAPLTHSTDGAGQGTEMFEHIFPYCDRDHQQTFKQMQNAFQMMRTVQQFSESGMFDHMSDMMGKMAGSNGTNPFEGMNGFGGMETFAQMAGFAGNREHSDQLDPMLSSMMTPEQQALFKEYEAMLDDL